MTEPQRGIFQEDSRHHHFLEYSWPPEQPREAIARALVEARAAARTGRGAGPAVVVAFGPRLWGEIARHDMSGGMPEGLRDFAAIEGAGGLRAPATQRDLLFWVQGGGRDGVLDHALAIHRALGVAARLVLDLTGFTYHDSRDLTGFIDGTANPKDAERREVALVPAGLPGAGGAFVLSQK